MSTIYEKRLQLILNKKNQVTAYSYNEQLLTLQHDLERKITVREPDESLVDTVNKVYKLRSQI